MTRTPTQSDLPAILELTRENRTLLATLEPQFWRKSANADELHKAFVTSQITNEKLIKRILERDGQVIGYAVSSRHPSGFYFIDDICLSSSADWATDGVHLLASIEERPAIMTAPHRDLARITAALAIGLELISTVRSFRFDVAPPRGRFHPVMLPVPDNLAAPPIHVWLPAMKPEFITVISDGGPGYAVLSPPLTVPPIYDPGGASSVVDRVIGGDLFGGDRRSLLMNALRFSAGRGDVGVILIVETHDTELSAIADELGASHPIDIFKWPEPRH